MKCFYHRDSDGKGAAFWVALNAGITDYDKGYDGKFIEIEHGIKFPMDIILPDEQVYIVDYSISPDEMRELLKITKDVTWIDHHISAIDKYKDFEYDIRGVRQDGVSGCMLTYCYIHHMTQRGSGEIIPFNMEMTKDAPLFTKYIDDWDIWKFEFGDDTKYFQAAFNSYNFDPFSEIWWKFLEQDDFEREMIREGKIITRYKNQWSKEYTKLGFETMFEGHKCFAMNIGLGNSEYFNSILDGKYDILMPFVYNGKYFKVSMYSKNVDVSKIAAKHGGGGHKGASGFECKELPFKKNA